MSLAQNIQTALLPREIRVPGLEVSASMTPATEVGGDYYEVLPTEHGCWFGIGDVAGHGLESGLQMLMIQSSVLTLVRANPLASPRDVVVGVNRTLVENLRDRLRATSFATLVVLRYDGAGQVVFAGAHEELVVWRHDKQACEIVPTPGTWVGTIPDITPQTLDSKLQLEPGDVLVLYTDGVIEARDAKRAMFGVERVSRIVAEASTASVDEIRARVLAAVSDWQNKVDDDATLIVIRRPIENG
jgi:serine phosphatase RsbU (regulator of sigma subunit)